MKAWIDKALAKGITDVQFFAVRTKNVKLTVYQHQIDEHVQSDVEVVTMRGIYNGKMASVRFEHNTNTVIDIFIDQLIDHASAITSNDPAIIFEGSKEYPKIKDSNYDFGSVPTDKKIQLLKDIEVQMEQHPKLKQVQSVVYQESDVETSLMNSKGIDLSQRSTYAYAYAVGVFHENDDIQSAMEITLAKTFDEMDAKKIAEETVSKGVKKLGASSMASKRYPVVFENKTFGSILGAFGSNFSAESAYRNLTPLKDKVGQSIANDFVQLVDDPLDEKAFQQMAFDHEGVACRTKDIIKDGVFQGFLHNLKTASIFKQEPTGNSFGGGISSTNLVMKPGTKSFEEMIAPIQDGVFINNLMGLHAGVKASSGDFSIQASGFRIENGQLSKPVKMIVVSGNFFTMMNEIADLDNELEYNLSSIAAPNVYIQQLGIAGE